MIFLNLRTQIYSALADVSHRQVRCALPTKRQIISITQNIFYFLAALVFIGSQPVAAAGLPTGGKVEAGQASIAQTANTVNVNQTSQRAVVSWNSFDVAKGNTVNFNQPNAGAVILNRVNSVTPSMINGAVNAEDRFLTVGGEVVKSLYDNQKDFLMPSAVQMYLLDRSA